MPYGDGVLDQLLARLREAGGDTDDIEVKSAAGGLSPSLTGSLCAISNLPTGGWVILGLDEKAAFSPVALSDVGTLKQGLAGKARACEPPVQLSFFDTSLSDMPVVVAQVAATASSAKPCRVRATGQAWMRSWDGDVTMSSLEEQAFLAQRTHPAFDEEPVAGAQRDDLDAALVAIWADTVRTLDATGLGRFERDELLFRAGVIAESGTPTVAGLLTLGIHPQQFFPRAVVHLSVQPDSSGVVRAGETATLSGPIPTMLEGALAWARKSFQRQVVTDSDGSVRDQWEYPLEAFRELIGNALVHRDLDQWSRGEAVEVRLSSTQLRVTNPGGLYGITVDRLGVRGTTSARNARLVAVCQFARASDGSRVVETLASGIPRIVELLGEGDMPGPQFHDNSLRFTAILRRGAAPPNQPLASLNQSQRAVYSALVYGSLSATELASATGLREPTVRKALRALADLGFTTQQGGRGRPTVYDRAE